MKASGFSSSRESLTVGDRTYIVHNPSKIEGVDPARLSRRPKVERILLENLVRNVARSHVDLSLVQDLANGKPRKEGADLPFYPARILLQDFTGVPVVVDLASMRAAAKKDGNDPTKVDSWIPIDLVIDHSIQVDSYGSPQSLASNLQKEYERNGERYAFLRWAQGAFPRLRVVPPGNGICHQVNMEYLASVVATREAAGGGTSVPHEAFPDTVLGTDSHTTMINGLGVLGWGVGGIEAEAVMLGEPYVLPYPEVVGVRLDGVLHEGVTATDVVLRITQLLRKTGVVGKFVEFYGPGVRALSVQERATLSNMCPEYGATAALFPIDAATLSYLRASGRPEETVKLVEAYAHALGLWQDERSPSPEVALELVFDIGSVVPTMAGPKNPDEARTLSEVPASFREALAGYRKEHPAPAGAASLPDGSIAIAAITSCTNTSNPAVMIGAGLLAKHAVAKGLRVPPHVKTSLAPGSRVVASYLERSGLVKPLEELGFAIVGYGCTTCIGNSGPLNPICEKAVADSDTFLVAVLSGNRNFEARVHNQVRANYLASPLLVVASALAGRVDIDIATEPLGKTPSGHPVMLKDIWPTSDEVRAAMEHSLDVAGFRQSYSKILDGGSHWDALRVGKGLLYDWEPTSTYLREAPYFEDRAVRPPGGTLLEDARVLALLGDNVSTDHISPAGEIPPTTPAGKYLIAHGVPEEDFNTYGSRRGNHEVMARGTFANTRLKNYLAPQGGGGRTTKMPEGQEMAIFDASELYRKEGRSLIVLAGQRYGQGSSRDWAAKGPLLLGVRAVIAQSYERIHRSNLAGMGVLPLEFRKGESWKSLGLTGKETYSLSLANGPMAPHAKVTVHASGPGADGTPHEVTFEALLRLDSEVEVDYYRTGGLLPYAMGKLFSR